MKNSIKALSLALSLLICAVFSACSKDGGANIQGSLTTLSEVSAASKETQANNSENQSQLGSDVSSDLWKTALYTSDAELGKGAVTIKVKVAADNKEITITLHTDSDTLGKALLDNKLVSGTQGEYGLYIKTVNGIEADYDKNKAYWAISKGKEYLTTSADATKIADGEAYELTYTNG